MTDGKKPVRRVFFAIPADFMDSEGTVIELGMRVALLDEDGYEVGYGEVCMFDEDSSQPIGVVSDLDSYPYPTGIRWVTPDEIRAL